MEHSKEDLLKAYRTMKTIREFEARIAKERLFQEKELWRVTLQSIADGVITTDLDGRVNYLNPVAEKMTGWSNAEAQQQPLPTVMQLLDEAGETPVAVQINRLFRWA